MTIKETISDRIEALAAIHEDDDIEFMEHVNMYVDWVLTTEGLFELVTELGLANKHPMKDQAWGSVNEVASQVVREYIEGVATDKYYG